MEFQNFLMMRLKILSDIAKNDIIEAILALTCGIPTASAMISLRAVEAAIREIYKLLKGKPCELTWEKL